MGAWIETKAKNHGEEDSQVALYMGAWIETLSPMIMNIYPFVALYMGAWIETFERVSPSKIEWSHSIWVRGLKLASRIQLLLGEDVALYMGAWIETCPIPSQASPGLSHSIWVRGLKHLSVLVRLRERLSHSIWVRGLKLPVNGEAFPGQLVALYMGAWIETPD